MSHQMLIHIDANATNKNRKVNINIELHGKLKCITNKIIEPMM